MAAQVANPFIYISVMKARAFDVGAKLDSLLERKIIEERNLRGRVLDIGVGYGGSYTALKKYSDDVTGIEPKRDLADMLIEHGIVSKDRLFVGNPQDFLRNQKDNAFDFIATLHLFSYDYGLRIEDFHADAVRALRRNGQLIYSAEVDTLSGLHYCKKLKELPEIEGTTKLFIPKYPIGPDNLLLIVTKL